MQDETGKANEKTPHDYVAEVSVLLRRKSWKNALRLAKEAYGIYPDDPFVLSYYGYLATIGDSKKRDDCDGIKACKQALKILKKSDYDVDSSYPWLYLNLGRAYLAAGNKKQAFDTFHKGLVRDKHNKDLLWELKRLGLRRPPVLSFLGRSNPVNRALGKIRHKLKTR